jgi:hypothetical protein
MRWRIDAETALALGLLAALAVAVLAVDPARFDLIDFFIVGLDMWPVVLVAGVLIAAWLARTRSYGADIELNGLGLRRAEMRWLAVLLAPVLFVVVGAVSFNWRVVSCSMADQAACPDVSYEDIRLPRGYVADPYSIDFREPRLPRATPTRPGYPGVEDAEWLILYKTWGDGDWLGACRSSADDTITCDLLDPVDEFRSGG